MFGVSGILIAGVADKPTVGLITIVAEEVLLSRSSSKPYCDASTIQAVEQDISRPAGCLLSVVFSTVRRLTLTWLNLAVQAH